MVETLRVALELDLGRVEGLLQPGDSCATHHQLEDVCEQTFCRVSLLKQLLAMCIALYLRPKTVLEQRQSQSDGREMPRN